MIENAKIENFKCDILSDFQTTWCEAFFLRCGKFLSYRQHLKAMVVNNVPMVMTVQNTTKTVSARS